MRGGNLGGIGNDGVGDGEERFQFSAVDGGGAVSGAPELIQRTVAGVEEGELELWPDAAADPGGGAQVAFGVLDLSRRLGEKAHRHAGAGVGRVEVERLLEERGGGGGVADDGGSRLLAPDLGVVRREAGGSVKTAGGTISGQMEGVC